MITVENIDADNIKSGSLSADRIGGGTLTIYDSEGGSFSVGDGTTHASTTGLNVGRAGINIREGKLILTSDGNNGYFRSTQGLSYILPLDRNGNTIPAADGKAMNLYNVFQVVKYCLDQG